MMSNNDLLIALLTAIGNRVPILIALGVALVMVLDTPRGRVRTVALSALTLLLATSLVGGLLAVLPLWLLSSGDFQRLSGLGSLLGVLQMARGLVEALGMVALAWALVHALRAGAHPPSA